MDPLSVAAQANSFGNDKARSSEDAYYRQHDAGRERGIRLMVPLFATIGFCVAAIGLIPA